MNKLKFYLIGLIVFLLIALGIGANLYFDMKADRDRQKSNMENITAEHARVLEMKKGEYNKLNTDWKTKLDSTLKANDINLKNVKQATVIKIQYRDTGSVKIQYKEAAKQTDGSYKIPVSYNSHCWGMEGQILTRDSLATFDIFERKSYNSAQLVVTRKRFLGFLWHTKKETFRAFSDCGEIDLTRIDFIK